MGCQYSHLSRHPSRLLSQQLISVYINEGRLQQAQSAADDLFQEGHFESAIKLYQKIIETDLSADYGAIGLGNLQLLEGMLPNSKYEVYQLAIESQMVKKNPHDALSMCYASLADSNKLALIRGIQWYEAQIQKGQNYQIYMGYANLLFNTHCIDEAITQYKRAISLKPSIVLAYIAIIFIRHYFRNNHKEVIQMMEKLSKIDPSNIYYRFLKQIERPSTQKQKFTALKSLYKQFPNYLRIKNEIGICYAGLVRMSNAIKEYQACIDKDPTYAVPYFNLANCLECSGKWYEAINMYIKACLYKPNFHQAYTHLAKIFIKLKSTDEQIKNYAIKCTGLSLFNYEYYLGVAYAEGGDLRKAMKWYQSALNIDRNSCELYNSIAVIQDDLLFMQKQNKCLPNYQQSLKRNPNYEIAYYNMAIYYKKQKLLEKSKECYEKALKIDPRFCEALNNLGNIYKEEQNYKLAIDCYKKAIKYDSTFILAYTNLIICEQMTRGTKRSFTTYLKAKEQSEGQWRGRLQEKSRTYVRQNLDKYSNAIKKLQERNYQPIFNERPSLFINEDDHCRLNYRYNQLASLQTNPSSPHHK